MPTFWRTLYSTCAVTEITSIVQNNYEKMGRETLSSVRKRNKAAKGQLRRNKNRRIAQEIVVELVNNAADFVTSKDEIDCKSIVNEIVNNSLNICQVQEETENSDEYDFPSFIDDNEYNLINFQQLSVEAVPDVETQLHGYRIVEIDYFINKTLTLQSMHNKHCTGGRLLIKSEIKKGLVSTFIFQCNICDREESICSEMPHTKKSVVNTAAVWGTLSTGSSYAHLSEFLSVLDVPSISGNQFFEIQRQLSTHYEDSLWETMESAGQEERKLAIDNNDVDTDGVPHITVYLDGGWSKRSYGHNYNASSGVAVIIGRRTGKLLFLGVRNKYCSICARFENKQIVPAQHLCFKNYEGPSASMEQEIITEGFNNSILMHNLRYKKFIADGDSSVFAKIKQNVIYGPQVQKLECLNHCIKNYSKHLYQIKQDTKGISLAARKLLTPDIIKKLVKAAQKAVYANAHGDLQRLKEDMRNSINHVFGNHLKCQDYLCNCVSDTTLDKTAELISSGAHHHIYAALNLVLVKSPQLIDNETNNRAELFMSILARFNMGKRLNLIQRDSFQTRSYLTGLRYNLGSAWHQKSWKKFVHKSPGKTFKKYVEQQEQRQLKRKASSKPNRSVKKLKFSTGKRDYGSNIAEIIVSDEDITHETNNLLERLKVSADQRTRTALETVGQFDNPKYVSERLFRLTASHFGDVIRRKAITSCHALVTRILKPNSSTCTAAMEYGKKNEIVAIVKFEEKTGKTVLPAGLYIDLENGFLGASPDGIINEKEIVEVKCFQKVAELGVTLEQATQNKQVACLEINSLGKVQLKRSHNYFYQIQGQLAITNAEICHFVVYTGDKNDLFIEEIHFHKTMWQSIMLPKLKDFYLKCIAPNIIEDRLSRGLKCRDPPSIIEAQEVAKKRKREKEGGSM